jgi:protein SCO1/2
LCLPDQSTNVLLEYKIAEGDIKRMSTRTIGLILAGILAGAAFAYIAIHRPGLPQGSITTGMPSVGGPFAMTDQTGKRVTEKDFLGRYMLVFFGFTHCPDICPSGLQVMSAALDSLGEKAAEVTPVFVTLDPERDTPAVLKEYLKSFHPNLVGLTGTPEEVSAIAKAYRVYYQKVTDKDSPNDYTYDHSAIFYLMGKDGKFITPIPHTTSVEEFSKALSQAAK